MNHKQAEERNMAELYLSQGLSPDEELAFEEHLLTCEICREKIQMLEDAKEAIELAGQEQFRGAGKVTEKNGNTGKKFFSIYHFAAVIIILIAFTGIIMIFSDKRRSPSAISTVAEQDDKSMIGDYPSDSTYLTANRDSTDQGKTKEISEYIAANFEPYPFYENLVNESYRNAGLKIKNPFADTLRQLPSFSWEDRGHGSVTLILINNHGKKIFSGIIKNGTIPGIKFDPGLYYWQLQDDEETLFTGRFIFLPLNDQ